MSLVLLFVTVSLECMWIEGMSENCATAKDVQNWRAPWKNRIRSATMKLRKSLIKLVMWQNILSCLVLPPEIVMHDALMLFSERPPIYVSSCMTISGGRTKQHIVIGFGELAAVD